MKKLYSFTGRNLYLFLLLILFVLFTGIGPIYGQLLDPLSQPRFINPLPVINDVGLRIDLTSGKPKVVVVQMRETEQNLGLVDITGNPLLTKVWGYKFPGKPTTYPGATIVAMKDTPIQVKWLNNLPAHFLPVDASLHMSHPDYLHTPQEIAGWYDDGNVPTVTHLHGGHTESASDGLPEAWFTQHFLETGDYFVKKTYKYDNDQEAATLWYHDHALGITRLNVYAGLAGFYLLRDANENMLNSTGVLPSGDYEIEMVIQDRMFDMNGQLYWPAYPGDEAYEDFITGEGAILPDDVFPGGGPSVLAEFFGDFILVNGMAWPNLNVEPRKYRFRLLNGSDSRFYILEFSDGTQFLQIGTDNGLIEQATPHDRLIIAPGERYDVVVDFTGKSGSQIIMKNFGPDSPFGGEPVDPQEVADPATTGQIMQFSVNLDMEPTPNATVTAGSLLRPAIVDHPTTGVPTRQLVLFEGMDEFGRLQPLLGTLQEGSLSWFEPITENPQLNDVEVWEVYNATEDAHPIHLHLVSFQIINRETFNGTVEEKDQAQHNGSTGTGGILTLDPDTPLEGDITGPGPQEQGWKDTFIVPPGQVGRVVAKFDRPGRYVWHCHILSHEDHEMMRPYYVGPLPVTAAGMALQSFMLSQNYPNPFYTSTSVKFTLNTTSEISITVTDESGNIVWTDTRQYDAGDQTFNFDGTGLLPGTYYLQLQIGSFIDSKRMFKL
jgi:spore coat protein A, manganese oxidase